MIDCYAPSMPYNGRGTLPSQVVGLIPEIDRLQAQMAEIAEKQAMKKEWSKAGSVKAKAKLQILHGQKI